MNVGRASLALAALAAVAGAAVVRAQSPARAPAAARRARVVDQCVSCHARLSYTTGAGHGFAAWKGSPHAAAGVGCEACHGGDPRATDPQQAHVGVVPSSDPGSQLYFTRIPDTCGRCHAAEAGYFRTSLHYARLRSDGRGPNCVTCHGSMATSVLTPERMLGTCSACHTAGGVAPVGKAREAARVLALARAENILFDVVKAGVTARAGSGAGARARVMVDEADRHLKAAAEVWHSFRLDSVMARLDDARVNLVGAWVALGHPAPYESQLSRQMGGAARP